MIALALIPTYLTETMRISGRKLKQMRKENLDILYKHTPFEKEDLKPLLPNELFILVARFGFFDGQEKTFEAIGNILGVTRQRVHSVHNRALSKLQRLKRMDA